MVMSDIIITNREFLSALRMPSDTCGYIPYDSVQWVCNWAGDANLWTGKIYSEAEYFELPDENTYFNLSLLQQVNGIVSRRKDNFLALQCIVLDDIGTKVPSPHLSPSWILETSPGNQQWGYILSEPILDLAEAEALMEAVIRAGYSDPGAGGPATRYMRLPIGSNSKPEHTQRNGGRPIPHRLLWWQPQVHFAVHELTQGLNLLVYYTSSTSSLSASNLLLKPSTGATDAALIKSLTEGISYHDSLVQLTARYAGRGYREHDIIEVIYGVMLANGDKSERWKERFDDIPRLVASAVKKYQTDSAASDMSFVDFSMLAISSPPPREWIVKEWIPRGCLTILFGKGGVGKSLLCQQLGIAVASGTNFLGLETSKGRALGLFCEDDTNELLRRGQRIFSRNNISPWEIGTNLRIDARAGKANLLAMFGADRKINMEPLWEHLNARCAEIKPAIILLDNIAQLYGGLENDRTQVTSFCNKLTGLAHEYNCGVLLLGHPAKGELSEYSGSTAWEAAVRTRLFLKPSLEGALNLSKAKANYSMLEDIRIQYHEGTFVRLDTTTEIPLLLQEAKEHIISALHIFIARQQNCSHHRNANNYILRMMQRDNLLGNIPAAIAEQAVNMLIDEKVLIPNSDMGWKGSSRHAVIGLAFNSQ